MNSKVLQGLIGKTIKSAFDDHSNTILLFEDGTGVRIYVYSGSGFIAGLIFSSVKEPSTSISVVEMDEVDVRNFINSRRAQIEAKLNDLRSLPNLGL